MSEQQFTFGGLFKKFRLKSGFTTLREFGDALAEKGFLFEDSLFSHWQKNTRIPKNRKILLAIVEIFLEKGGISSVRDVNIFLESVDQGSLTEKESTNLAQKNYNSLVGLNSSPKKILEFLLSTTQSKKLVRTGWVRERIKDPESVAEHSFQLSVMAMIFADHFGVDKEKLIKMAILHDLGELVTGDIVVWTKGNIIDVEKQVKKEAAELAGITKIFNIINKSSEYRKIFKEMIEGKSPEVRIFWQLDKLEMAIQALLYEKEQGKRLSEFFVTSNLQIQSPFLRKILKQILKSRPKIVK